MSGQATPKEADRLILVARRSEAAVANEAISVLKARVGSPASSVSTNKRRFGPP
jgi:hypothetical protein